GRYATTEQTMDLLAQAIGRSARMKGAVVVFDGFTGFTPIQYHVLSSIIRAASRVTVSLPAEPGTDPFDAGQEGIFSLTAKTVADLERAAFLAESPDAGANRAAFAAFCAQRRRRAGDLFLRERPVARLRDNPPLAFFEERIFREEAHYEGETGDAVRLVEAPDPAGECTECCLRILSYIKASDAHRFEDIAVLSTDPAVYGPLMDRTAARFGIPVYIDETAGIRMNPLTECVSGALQILTDNYSAAAVFRFLRSGLTGLTAQETDRLQLYTEALGIRGRRRYEEEFTRLPARPGAGFEKTAYLEGMNGLRRRFLSHLERFPRGTKCEVKAFSDALLGMLEDLGAREKLEAMAAERRAQGDEKGCLELTQIYGKLVELVEQMKALFGGGRITVREYGELLQVGINKITIGMLPAGIDRVMVGDLERTRLGGKRVLFLLGANDSKLPGNAGGGGILNEMDRRFLSQAGTGVELAPDPVQRLSYERQYLYMNLTLPSESLILSWSLASQEGAQERPAELIRRIRELFPGVRTEHAADRTLSGRIGSRENAAHLAAELFRLYADGRMEEQGRTEFLAFVAAVGNGGADYAARMRRLTDAAFYRYVPQSVSPEAAVRLYGGVTESSVSRLETFAGCPFAHFARYGLRLAETELFEVDHADLGVLYHGALSAMDAMLRRQGRDLTDLSDGEAAQLAQSVLRDQAAGYRNGILLSNTRYQFMLRRLLRTLVRTVHTVRYQLSKGVFRSFASELDFTEGDGRMLLRGRIDRLDAYEDPAARYLRVIDYKSGKQTWDPNLYVHGISLQLMVYLRAALTQERNSDTDRLIVPAGVFYYHIDDPILKLEKELITSDIESRRIKSLSMKGVANTDRRILVMMDQSLDGEEGAKSDVLPMTLKKDGTPDAHSHGLTTEEFELVSRYTDHQIRTLGERIRDGETGVHPYRYKKQNACTWCAYRGICGFDRRITGYTMREIAGCGREELLDHMREQLHE
ncbi:MAG: PD-(D/E)XK nuclease family protein, partial [Lachnospiraceae bacterium]|nr:PD-(D/E)XK nuclease family protein [Lachnospiraceae bacterium]